MTLRLRSVKRCLEYVGLFCSKIDIKIPLLVQTRFVARDETTKYPLARHDHKLGELGCKQRDLAVNFSLCQDSNPGQCASRRLAWKRRWGEHTRCVTTPFPYEPHAVRVRWRTPKVWHTPAV